MNPALVVVCPKCLAEIGQKCDGLMRGAVHAERIKAAKVPT